MQLAIHQTSGPPGEIQANLALLAQTAAKAATAGADFLVLPELFLTGYNIGEAIADLAQTSDSKILQQVAQIAGDYHLALLLGYPEQTEDGIYNSALLVSAEGQRIGSYRKTHLFGAAEQRWFRSGSQWLVCSIAGVRVGVLICFDVEFPEAVRSLTTQGAQLIAVPTANMFPYTQIPERLVPVRAMENQVFLAYVNRVGQEGDLNFCGLSCVVGPDGKDLVRAGFEDELLTTKIDLEAIAQERMAYCYLSDRRPDIYCR